jgi:hypothetical protein
LHRPAAHVFNDAIMHGFSLGATVFAVFAVSQVVALVASAADAAAVLVQVIVSVVPFFAVLVPAFIYLMSRTGGHVTEESKRLSDSMIARAGGDRMLAEKLRDARVKRIQDRFNKVEGVALPLSPYGLLARFFGGLARILR